MAATHPIRQVGPSALGIMDRSDVSINPAHGLSSTAPYCPSHGDWDCLPGRAIQGTFLFPRVLWAQSFSRGNPAVAPPPRVVSGVTCCAGADALLAARPLQTPNHRLRRQRQCRLELLCRGQMLRKTMVERLHCQVQKQVLRTYRWDPSPCKTGSNRSVCWSQHAPQRLG
jgi:hypothetical protein